jgi:hypothetical protein
MSVHVEWLDAGACAVELHREGAEMPDGQNVDSPFAFALGGDDVVVIEGTLDELRALVVRLGAVLASAGKRALPGLGPEFCEEHPDVELENDIDEDGKGVATCPRCVEEES